MLYRTSILVLAAVVLAGCGDDGGGACDPVAATGCDDGQVCELVGGGAPACFAPVVIAGRVFDLASGGPIAGARIVAVDANGAPAGSVAVSDAEGAYAVGIATTRAADGTPVGGSAVTLRADAAGYLTFPSGVRSALPIDTRAPVADGDRFVVSSDLTDIGLLALTGAPGGQIHGEAAVNDTHAPVLVVVESAALGAVRGRSAIADRDGDYRLYNLPAGDYTVTAYAAGHSYPTKTVSLAAGQDAAVDLALDEAATSTLSGSVQLVNPQAGTATSVILVVESTFDPRLVRGDSPAGLRAPGPPSAPDVTGAFRIEGVPAGRYVVLAAFENDQLVRDASSIGGTEIVHQLVEAGQDVAIAESFKVTGAVELVGPGADGPELVVGTPVFRWIDDSSEDRYRLTVFDAYGAEVWTHVEPSGARDPSTTYAGPALRSGMTYQFRVVSIKDPAEELSRSEELRGVFTITQ